MFSALGVPLLVFAVAEFFLIIKIGENIGALPTIGALILISAVGVSLVKRQGMGIIRRIAERAQLGQKPGSELVDGFLLLLAGLLLLIPGFISDVLGLLLLTRPFRALVRGWVAARITRRVGLLRRISRYQLPG